MPLNSCTVSHNNKLGQLSRLVGESVNVKMGVVGQCVPDTLTSCGTKSRNNGACYYKEPGQYKQIVRFVTQFTRQRSDEVLFFYHSGRLRHDACKTTCCINSWYFSQCCNTPLQCSTVLTATLQIRGKRQTFTLLPLLYTVNHKKHDILFLTITLANLNRFLQFLYHFNCEEILHATVVKFTTSP